MAGWALEWAVQWEEWTAGWAAKWEEWPEGWAPAWAVQWEEWAPEWAEWEEGWAEWVRVLGWAMAAGWVEGWDMVAAAAEEWAMAAAAEDQTMAAAIAEQWDTVVAAMAVACHPLLVEWATEAWVEATSPARTAEQEAPGMEVLAMAWEEGALHRQRGCSLVSWKADIVDDDVRDRGLAIGIVTVRGAWTAGTEVMAGTEDMAGTVAKGDSRPV